MAAFVGSDRADVEFVDASSDAHGDRYLSRIYADEETRQVPDGQEKPYAVRRKEATMKAIGETAS